MSIAKHQYVMDYIDDPVLFKAVMFACSMIRNGQSVSVAIRKASKYYNRDMSDIAFYVGQRGGRRKAER